ncbi:MAG: DASS family sodium-coupled anion symporter [Acidobacteria bacterium]|nr:DASS family sodium-coupled anion symporter [Acidobacteriota bacterium]
MSTSVSNAIKSSQVTTAEPKLVLRGAITVLAAVIIWFAPIPEGVDEKAWHLFAIFFATIIGLILQPLPLGAVVLIGTTATMLTHTLTIAQAMAGYMNATVWLIVAAFLFARAFSKTGLGRRIAYLFIRLFGHRTLGLAYALAMTDLVLAPGIPSGAARTGGVMFPIVKSLASTYGSEPGATAGRIGTFLMLSAYQVHAVTCAMFLTSMVANPLIAQLTKETVNIEITWAGWAIAALVPGLISFSVLPYLVFRMTKPEIRETPEATDLARAELAKMGPLSRHERVVLGVFLMVFGLWITGSQTGLEATVVAFLGLCVMLILGALKWEDVLAERAGWDALIWFGGLVGMAAMLNTLGLIPWFSKFVGSHVQGWPWLPALGILALVYMYSHYFFASLAAHTTAFFVPFLTVAVAAGAPPYFSALTFAFFSSLCVSLTHYGGGPSPVYWGSGYADIKQWWTVGFAASLLFVLVWMGIGPFWWKALGLF